jgi:hypothetical protein
MERGLRDLIAKNSGEEFRGIYLENGLNPTRKNILAPGSIGIYSAGSNYNPAQVMRDSAVKPLTEKIDKLLEGVRDKSAIELSIAEIQQLIKLTKPNESASELLWNPIAVAESVGQFAKLKEQKTGFVYVDRDRGLVENRRETQGIIEGGEVKFADPKKIALFLLRTKGDAHSNPSWWPQIRFPDGSYAFAFAV